MRAFDVWSLTFSLVQGVLMTLVPANPPVREIYPNYLNSGGIKNGGNEMRILSAELTTHAQGDEYSEEPWAMLCIPFGE